MPKTSRTKKAATVRHKNQVAIVRQESPTLAEAIEKVLIGGDLAPLSVEQRLDYYKKVCQSLGLNPLTRPFDYIVFDGKMQLYARRDCTDQLRKLHGISVISVTRGIEDGMLVAEARVRDREGKEDSAIGVLSLTQWDKWAKPPAFKQLSGLELANARMKVETKAKRRATLSICGLGFLDMSELDTIEGYSEVTAAGRVITQADGSEQAAKQIAQDKLKAHEEGKPIESQPDAPEILSVTVTPWKEGRMALAGNGLQAIKSELGPEVLEELDIKLNAKEKVVHMATANVFTLQDRARKFGVDVTLVDVVGGDA